MRGRPRGYPLLLAVAPTTGLADLSPLTATTESEADGAVHLLCSDSDGTPHPKRASLFQTVGLDAGDEGSRLIFGYSPDLGGPASRGRIKATAKLFRPDGTSRRLGRLSTEQNRANGEALVDKLLSFAPQPGDTIEWKLKLKNFEPLAAGQCLALIAMATRPPVGCGPYPDRADSEYVLPYNPGEAYFISQGNCAVGSHRGAARYAYDFAMPRGTEILAARAGTVVAVDDSRPDDTGLFRDDNAVVVEQDDGTLAAYVHIRQGGALVTMGERVEQGQPLALSGNSGHTSGVPHLHFQVTPCPNRRECGTLPVTFRNTRAHPEGLALGRSYRAEADQ